MANWMRSSAARTQAAANFRGAIAQLTEHLEQAKQAATAAKEATAAAAKEAEEAKERQAKAEGMDNAWSMLEERLPLASAEKLRVELAKKDETLKANEVALKANEVALKANEAELAKMRARLAEFEGVPPQ